MKTSSKSYLILGITFIIVALMWFIWLGNPMMGVVWLIAGLVELIIAEVNRRKK